MPISRNQTKVYIKRAADEKVDKLIAQNQKRVIYIYGQGGVGKTTLLKKLLKRDLPIIYINLQKNIKNIVDILLDRSITTTKNTPKFNAIRDILLNEPKLLNAILRVNSKDASGVVANFDEEYSKYVQTIIDTIQVFAKWKNKEQEELKKDILQNIEFVLLQALEEDFSNNDGLFMIDTFEKSKNFNIESKVEFLENGEIDKSFKTKYYQFKTYIEGISFFFLPSRASIIVAGRNKEFELENALEEYIEKISLSNFTEESLSKYFKESNLTFTKEQLKKAHMLTNGNPLMVCLFVKMVKKEYNSSLESLDYKEMEKRVKEDKKYGLIFYMTNRILTHLKNFDTKELYKIIIPRVLTSEIAKVLFKKDSILEELEGIGILNRGERSNFSRYFLHDDIKRAIEVFFEKELKENFSSWHDNKKVKKIHKKLIEFYKKNEIYGVNRDFEICYHNIMLRENFEKDFKIKREEFASLALGLISLNLFLRVYDKSKFCNDFNTLSKEQIFELIKLLEIQNIVFSHIKKVFNLEEMDKILEKRK